MSLNLAERNGMRTAMGGRVLVNGIAVALPEWSPNSPAVEIVIEPPHDRPMLPVHLTIPCPLQMTVTRGPGARRPT